MQREIKFRAWDNIKKEWLLGYEYKSLGGFSICGEMMMMGEWSNILNQMLHGYFGEQGEELKVMQYTGLKDKNGVEIYEGDIVQGVVKKPQLYTWDCDENCNTKMAGEVYYDYCGFSLKVIQSLCEKERDGMVNYFDFVSSDDGDFDEMEVIGNIYQNLELLN